VPISVTVTRTGGQLTGGTYVLGRLYWSTDAVWDGGDTVLWDSGSTTFLDGALNNNGSVTANPTPTVSIPCVPAGTYYILAVVDPTNFYAESNEGNNVTPYTVQVAPLPAPTLVAPGSPTPPGPILPNLTPLFQWNAVSGASCYGLYVRDLSSGNLVYSREDLTGTSHQLPSGVLASGTSYRWNTRAFACACAGSPGSCGGDYASPWYFRTP
jgi:hypothetical protein